MPKFVVSIIRMEDDEYEVKAKDQDSAEKKAKQIWEEEHPASGKPWSVEVTPLTV